MNQKGSATVQKPGAVRFLRYGDTAKRNPYGGMVVGWKRFKHSLRSFINLNKVGGGFACLWMVVQKLHKGKHRDIYEQPKLVENPGCVVIPQLGDRFGLVRVYRDTGPRLNVTDPTNYLQSLMNENRWEELVASLGEEKWELPAGIAPEVAGSDLKQIIKKAAKLEAAEEGGFDIIRPRILKGMPNFNPTFFVHPQYVVHGQIKTVGVQKPEDLEIIGGVKLFTVKQIRRMIDSGQISDGKTMAAFTAAGIHIPR